MTNITQTATPHQKLKRDFFLGCAAVLSLSIFGFISVLIFQLQTDGSFSWDFQGASGVATVVPSFAGVILAAWAIYYQVRMTSPSYRAAENIWLEIAQMRRKGDQLVLYLSYAPETDTNEEGKAYPEPDTENSQPHADNGNTRDDSSRKRVNNEFKPYSADPGNRTYGEQMLTLLPIIDSLQHRNFFPKERRINVGEIQKCLIENIYLERDSETSTDWSDRAMNLINEIEQVCQLLDQNGLLEITPLEEALLHPRQAEINFQRSEDWRIAQEAKQVLKDSQPNLGPRSARFGTPNS